MTAQNFAADFKVLILEQNSEDLKYQIENATKDLDPELNVHIITANQNRDKLLVGSFDSITDLTTDLASDSKLYDLAGLSQQDYTPSGEGQVIIIDESVSYSQNILDTIPADWKVVTINSQEDGLTQILEKLEGSSNLSTIHIFSHGNSGEIILGNLVLDSKTIQERATDLAKLGTYLNSTGDILLYGCDVSSGYIGEEFVDLLAQKTSADVAASDDATGSYIASADFDLETTSGNVESSTLEVDTNGTVLGSFTYYDINILRNSQRLTLQASGEGGSGIWSSTENNWVDIYNTDRIVPYLSWKTVTGRFLFWSWSYDVPYMENYNYGAGVRYTENAFTIDKDSTYNITATISEQLKNYLGGERAGVSTENFALYKGTFDKYNPLKNLITASEGWLGEFIYKGELKAGKYTLVTSFDTFDFAFFKVDINYAEQMYGNGKLTIENLNRAPVWGNIADQTISGDGNKDIVATSWSNVSDADGDEIVASAVIIDGSLEKALPLWLTFNPNTLTFSGNPPANTGTLDIRIKAYDGQEYGYKDFKLIFTNDNDRPIIANEIKDITWDGQGVFTYQIPTNTFSDSDPGNDTFTYTAKLADGSDLPSWLSISSSGLISGNPPADYPSLTIVVTVNDGSGQANATQTDTFVLNLKNNNDVQVVTDKTISIDEDTTYTYTLTDFSYTDADTHAFNDTLSGDGKTIKSIRIVELPQNGTLWIDSNANGVLNDGEKVQLNQVILASSISKLKYTPNANWAGHSGLPMLDPLLNGPDTFKWISSDGYNDSSNTATTTLNVRLVNDDPQLSFSAGKTLDIRATGGSALNPVYVDQGLNLVDIDATYSSDTQFDTIFGVSVTIIDSTTNKFVIGDKLSLTGDTTGFTVNYDSVNGILSIEKAAGARASEYQTLLRTLQFSSTDTANNNLRTLGLSFRTQDVGSKTAAYFDGVDDYIETLNGSIPSTGDFTISTWAQLDNPANLAGGQYTIFGQGDTNNHLFLQVVKNSDNTYNLRIGNDWIITNISSLLSDGKWHQYTITRTGSGTRDGSLYIDGKYIESGDIKTTITVGYGLRIGRLYDQTINNSADYEGYWKGSISDIRVYNRVLSSVDIQKSLSNQLVGNESGLRAWYKLVSDYKNYASVSSDGGNAVVFKQANYGYSIKTGHYYKLDTTGRNYADANLNAQNSTYASENGYLARIDDSLSASELEVVKLMDSLKGSTETWIGAERSYSNGDWYWTAGPDSDVYFTHGSNEGLDNNPALPGTVYRHWWTGAFAGTWWSTDTITTNKLATQVTFDDIAWDSWDNERLEVKLNGVTLYNRHLAKLICIPQQNHGQS